MVAYYSCLKIVVTVSCCGPWEKKHVKYYTNVFVANFVAPWWDLQKRKEGRISALNERNIMFGVLMEFATNVAIR